MCAAEKGGEVLVDEGEKQLHGLTCWFTIGGPEPLQRNRKGETYAAVQNGTQVNAKALVKENVDTGVEENAKALRPKHHGKRGGAGSVVFMEHLQGRGRKPFAQVREVLD